MRVALVLPELDPRKGGGFTFQQALFDAVRAVAPATDHDFVYYTGGPPPPRTPDTVQLPLSRRSVAARALIGAVRDVQDRTLGVPRVVAPSTWFERSLRRQGVEAVWFTTPYAEDCDVPYVFTLWDLAYLEHPWFPEVSANGEWERRHRHYSRYLPRASVVAVPNHTGAEEVLRHFDVAPERILEASFPTPSFALHAGATEEDGARLSRLGVPERYVLYPAQYWAHKNHATLLRALVGLPDVHLVCVGSDKGHREHVVALARELGMADRLHTLGFVETEDLIALYRGAHALTYPTWFGPENLPPLEAFALGCPVVASDIPGASEQYGEAALLADPRDPAAWAEAVRALDDPVERGRMVEAGRRRASARTAADYVADVLERLDALAAIDRG